MPDQIKLSGPDDTSMKKLVQDIPKPKSSRKTGKKKVPTGPSPKQQQMMIAGLSVVIVTALAFGIWYFVISQKSEGIGPAQKTVSQAGLSQRSAPAPHANDAVPASPGNAGTTNRIRAPRTQPSNRNEENSGGATGTGENGIN